MVDQDQSREQKQENSAGDNSLENLDQFTDTLRTELAKTKPQITIITSRTT